MSYTLEEDCKTLCEALVGSKKIQWNRSVLLYALNDDFYSIVMKALEKTAFKFLSITTCDLFWIPKEEAINFDTECPPEVYVAKLDKSHAPFINSHWPHSYKDSDKYLATLIELNGGCGVFLKSDGTLVAWVIRNLIGLGALQTAEEYKRKGYGSLVAKALSKEVAKKGADPLATVLINNSISQNMFRKLGFNIIERILFINGQEHRNSD